MRRKEHYEYWTKAYKAGYTELGKCAKCGDDRQILRFNGLCPQCDFEEVNNAKKK